MFGKNKNENDPQLSWGKSSGLVMENWPKDESGEPEEAVALISLPDSNNEADMKINMLNAYGIPVSKRYNNSGDVGKLILGFSGFGATLYVPKSMAEDAKNLLTNAEEAVDKEEEI